MTVDRNELASAIEFIRPRLRGHAGDMDVQVDDDEGVVEVTFWGACESCPAMAVTYAGLVSTALEKVPGVTEVRAEQVHASPRALLSIRRRLGIVS
ncbi:NifU family protein [Subtercola lobariae]|uniref:NIF system FeS cluster assembly NifU C-terminal domain-containing protein n=1 Tax=Subtercola lobariae TaxID=1588641 RepID=A0A917BCN1_9MICO|nr:NifU family protein [Subtercola lobariae]GGF36240.1 hypothetical protein GCM10011399_31430 [Subtercola lobariae]